jgi:hypothetical protein
MVKLMETVSAAIMTLHTHWADLDQDYSNKMVVPLLKIELLSAAETFDSSEFYNGNIVPSCFDPDANVSSTSSNDSDYCSQRRELPNDHASHSQIERAQVRSEQTCVFMRSVITVMRPPAKPLVTSLSFAFSEKKTKFGLKRP